MKTNWIASVGWSKLSNVFMLLNQQPQSSLLLHLKEKSGMLINTLSYQLSAMDLYLCCWSKAKVVGSSVIDTVATIYEDQGMSKTLSVFTKSLQSYPDSYSTLADCTESSRNIIEDLIKISRYSKHKPSQYHQIGPLFSCNFGHNHY